MWPSTRGKPRVRPPPPTAPTARPREAPPPRLVTVALPAGANAARDMFLTESNLTDLYETFYANQTNSTGNLTGTSNQTFNEPYEHRVASFLVQYYTPLLTCLGCVGNLMSLFVFYRSKLRFQSTSQYLSALAVADTAFLLLLLPPWLHTMNLAGLFGSPGFCQVLVYATYVSCSTSAWLVVAFTVERFVAVLYPFRRNIVCTVKRARYTIYTIVLVSVVLNLPLLKLVLSSQDECLMDQDYYGYAMIFNAADTVVAFTLPLAVIIVLNAWIMLGVYRLERTRQQLVKPPAQPRGRGRSRRARRAAPARMLLPPPQCQRRVTRMLLIVSSVFVLLNLPAYTMRLLAYAYEMPEWSYSHRWKAVQQIALMFFNTNFGINFLLYCLTGQKFRRALVNALPCTKRRARTAETRRFAVSCRPVRASISTSFASCSEPTNTATTNVAMNVHAVTGGTNMTDVNSARRRRRRSGFGRWVFNNNGQRLPQQDIEMSVMDQPPGRTTVRRTCSTEASLSSCENAHAECSVDTYG